MEKWLAALRLTGVGFFIGICILGGVVGGLWLDNKFSTSPIWVIIGLLLGLAVAFYGVYQMLLPLLGGKRDGDS